MKVGFLVLFLKCDFTKYCCIQAKGSAMMCLMDIFLEHWIMHTDHLHRLYLCYVLLQLLNNWNNCIWKWVRGAFELNSWLKVEWWQQFTSYSTCLSLNVTSTQCHKLKRDHKYYRASYWGKLLLHVSEISTRYCYITNNIRQTHAEIRIYNEKINKNNLKLIEVWKFVNQIHFTLNKLCSSLLG